MGIGQGRTYLGQALRKHDGAALVFQIKQGEVIPGTQVIPQEGPVKGKLRSGPQGYRRFQHRPNGAGLPGGIMRTGR